MLVDLMRNDLSSICKVGSVNVDRFDVESYANVHHLVSHINGELLDKHTSNDALDAIFPGGSITGCPRTMVCAAIDQIEMTNRSFWTGSIGWFDPHTDNCSWNILIRTLEARKNGSSWQGVVGAGGGITIRSNPEMEVVEAIWKSQAIRKACGWLKPDFDLTNVGKLERTSLDIENRFEYVNCGVVTHLSDLNAESEFITNKVLIIDNLDSFTLNIAHAMAGLSHNVTVISGRGKIADEMSTPSSLFNLLQKLNPSHIIIGPGPGTPSDSLLSKAVSLHCLAGQIDCPVLGICLGHQSLAAAEQGIVKKSPNGAIHGTPIICHHDGEGIFADLESPQLFTRYNSLTIEIDSSKSKMLITAKDENGEIMALRHKELPIMSVQFHPESIGSPNGLKLLENFLSINRMLE